MPLIFKDFNKCIPPVSSRWTPIYLEHGRLEVDDSSVKWIGAEGDIIRIPVARISIIILGPGSVVTHAAICMCSRLNTPVSWVGEDGIYFYSFGVNVNEKCQTAQIQAKLYSDPVERERIALKMYTYRFKEETKGKSIEQLRGMEGARVKDLYYRLGKKYSVRWSGRNSSGQLEHILGAQDDINRMIKLSNFFLYSLTLSVALSMGYITSLGFIHVDGKIPFIYDIADLVKDDYIEFCFRHYSEERILSNTLFYEAFKNFAHKDKLLKKLPDLLKKVIC